MQTLGITRDGKLASEARNETWDDACEQISYNAEMADAMDWKLEPMQGPDGYWYVIAMAYHQGQPRFLGFITS